MVRTCLLASAALTLVAAAPQDAQTVPGVGNFSLPPSLPTPAPTPSPSPIVPSITLPTLTPTPTPQPAARPTPSPKPRATPSPRASESPRPAVLPTPTASPTPTPSPSAVAPVPVAVATVAPSPTPTVTPAPVAAAATDGSPLWPVLGVVALIALLGGAGLWWKRRRDAAAEVAASARRVRPQPPAKRQTAVVPPPKPTDALSEAPSFWTPSQPARLPDPVAPPPPPARPHIEIGIAPRRAGLNLLSATAEVEVLVRNEGDATATDIAIDVRLMNAQSEQDSQLGALFAAAMGKSAVPSFEVAPGDEQAIRAVATLPRDAIAPLMAADRPMFVPILTVDVRYDRGDGSRAQTAAAFMIGVVRDGSEKLAPFWLDTAPRMFDSVAVRPHAFSVRS